MEHANDHQREKRQAPQHGDKNRPGILSAAARSREKLAGRQGHGGLACCGGCSAGLPPAGAFDVEPEEGPAWPASARFRRATVRNINRGAFVTFSWSSARF